MTDLALALDLGGTKLDAALVDESGRLLPGSRSRRATGPDLDPNRLRAAIAEVVRGALAAVPEGATPRGAGIGTAGPIDRSAGTIAPVNLPGVAGFALRDEVAGALRAEGLDTPVRLGHDGGCLALAESWIGAARGARASISIVVSTGIGGGFVIDGMPVGGASGNAGHIGQTRGSGELTLEEVASGPSSVAWARTQGWHGSSGEDLGRAAAAGDPVARTAVRRSAQAVGFALADAATLLDLDVVAIGGGFSRVADDYVDLVAAALRSGAVLEYARRTAVVRTACGDDGPLVGAGSLILRAP